MKSQLKDKAENFFYKLSKSLGEGKKLNQTYVSRKNAALSLELDLPSIACLLPYEAITEEKIFINKNSIGFGLHIAPSMGADETLVKSMAEIIKNKLPINADLSFLLFKHHYLAARLEQGFKKPLSQGGIYTKLASLNLKYHQKAALQGYLNQRQITAQLADYSVYLFFSTAKLNSSIEELSLLRESIKSELSVAGLIHAPIEEDAFIQLMQAFLSPNLKELDWPKITKDKELPLSYQIPQGNGLIAIHDTHLESQSSSDKGINYESSIINCHIEKYPQQIALWQTPDLFANLLRQEHSIACPFLISFSIRGINQAKVLNQAKARAKSLNSNYNAIQQFLNPGMKEEREVWNYVYEEATKDNLALLPSFYNVVLFTSKEDERDMVAKAISSFRQLGFELKQSRATQWIQFLASLPFMLTEGLFEDLKTLGLIKHMAHYNIANMLPIVGDAKGSSHGMLLPTQRGQAYFLDLFDNNTLPITNYNFLTVGSSGAGKSMFQQAQILSGLSLGELTYVIDLGHSYKHLCELVGGTYIDVTNITLNPFTLFDFEGKTSLKTQEGKMEEVADYIQIRDLLCLMVSPEKAVDEVQKSYLLDASLKAWQQEGKSANMDDVIEALKNRSAITDDVRLTDLITLLNQYGTKGIYGNLFNGTTPLIKNNGLVVFEMGGFQNNPDLLTIVMFVMIVIIQGQFYQTPRNIKKRCIIDEAWRFLCEGSNPIAAHFIEQGFRTARKHRGGFGVITQYLADTDLSIQGQAIAASCDLKIIMRQGNFKAFCEKHPSRFTPLQKLMIESFQDAQWAKFSSLMIEAGQTYSFHRYFADPFTRILFSSSGEDFAAIERLCGEGLTLECAVDKLLREGSYA